MADININGQWTFVIVYGEDYGEDAGKEVFCDAEFIQDNDTFTATSFDTGGFGTNPDKATLTGFIDGDTISFVKQYASYHYQDENGQTIIDKSVPVPEINYFGTYNKQDNTFSGDWDMVLGSQQIAGSWLDESCGGTFIMKRK